MISYLQVVVSLPAMWPVSKMQFPICEYQFFGGDEDETLLVFFLLIINQNWAAKYSDIVCYHNYVENNCLLSSCCVYLMGPLILDVCVFKE